MKKPQPKYGWNGPQDVDYTDDRNFQIHNLKVQNERLQTQVAALNDIIDQLARAVPDYDLKLVVAPLNKDKDYTRHHDYARSVLLEDLRIALNVAPPQPGADTPYHRVPTHLKGAADRVPENHFALGF